MKKFETRPDTARASAHNDALESLLRNARGDGFTQADTEQIWSRLGPVLGARLDNAGLNSSTGSLPPHALGVLGTKAKVLLLLGGGVVAAGLAAAGMGGMALHGAPQAAESHARAAATGNDSSPLQAIDSAPIGILGGVGGPVALARPFSAIVQGGLPAAPSSAQSPNPSLPKRMESPARSLVDARVDARTGVAQAAQPAGVDKKPADTSTENPEAKEATAPVTQPPPADQVINEGALLLRARRQLASDPANALKLTEEHARVFPAGTLVPEREVLAIEALVQLGRLSEARTRFAAFRARFPRSPHLARLEGLVGH